MAEAEIPVGHPMRDAWEQYKTTEGFANARRWAPQEAHTDGSLWGSFNAGYDAASSELAALREKLEMATERLAGVKVNLEGWRDSKQHGLAIPQEGDLKREVHKLSETLSHLKEGSK